MKSLVLKTKDIPNRTYHMLLLKRLTIASLARLVSMSIASLHAEENHNKHTPVKPRNY